MQHDDPIFTVGVVEVKDTYVVLDADGLSFELDLPPKAPKEEDPLKESQGQDDPTPRHEGDNKQEKEESSPQAKGGEAGSESEWELPPLSAGDVLTEEVIQYDQDTDEVWMSIEETKSVGQ